MNKRSLLLAVAVVAVAVLGGVTLLVTQSGLFSPPVAWHGTLLNEPAADFTLTDQHGQRFTLSAQRGNAVLLFFGYTSCPDECPLTMGKFKQVYAALGADAQRVRFLLITVDPEVDTPAKLGEFVAHFEPAFLGLTGDAATLQAVWTSYGVYVSKHADTGAVDHSTRMYLIDPRGNWRVLYTLEDTSAEDLTQDVRQVLAGK